MNRYQGFKFLLGLVVLWHSWSTNSLTVLSTSDSIEFKLGKKYTGEYLKEIAFPLGGFGAGQVYIRGDGKLGSWQIMNNFNSNAHVSDAFFAVYLDNQKEKCAKLLQINPWLPAEGLDHLSFAGEFPFAQLDFGEIVPGVEITMECFSPFIPLDVKHSGLPAVFFNFMLHNKTSERMTGKLIGTIPNLVGWDGYGELKSSLQNLEGTEMYVLTHPELGDNVNALRCGDDLIYINFKRQNRESVFITPIDLVTNIYDIAHPLRYTRNVKIYFSESIRTDVQVCDEKRTVIWLDSLKRIPDINTIKELHDRISNGAVLIVSGDVGSLFGWFLAMYQSKGRSISEEIIDNFESGNYQKWEIEGDAFGTAPASGKFENQLDILGQEGRYFINTYQGDDNKIGKARSKVFEIRHPYLQFKIAGGNKPDTLYVALIVDGEKIYSATGMNSEHFETVVWNISPFIGKRGYIEIVDNSKEGWGHISVDDIRLSSIPPLDMRSLEWLKQWFSFVNQDINWTSQMVKIPFADKEGRLIEVGIPGYYKFKSGVSCSKLSRVIQSLEDGTPLIIETSVGKGKVIWCNGKMIDGVKQKERKEWIISLLEQVLGVQCYTDLASNIHYPTDGSISWGIITKDINNVEHCVQWSDFQQFWDTFSRTGKLPSSESELPSAKGRTWNGTLGYKFELNKGEKKKISFILTWYFPHRMRSNHYLWTLSPLSFDHRLGNYYNNFFNNSEEVLQYCVNNYSYLRFYSELFHNTFFSMSLPAIMLEAISANIATLHTPIYIHLEDGTVGGFEGTDNCCPLNCTHVYNYAQALPFLFPSLERRVRYQELVYQVDKTQFYIPHRFIIPATEPQFKNEIGGPHHHALDGELGTLLKLCREYQVSGDKEWIMELLPTAINVLRHILNEHDPTGEGIIRGEQPNTYDIHTYGSNTFIGTLYLATLKAMEELLKELAPEETDLIRECERRFEMGKDKYIEACWNGEYFINAYDAPEGDPQIYNRVNCYGPGCHSDQLLGQWWAWILNIGYLFPREYIHSALQSIYKFNWRENFYGHVQQPRRFVEDDEPGLLMCSWPKGGRPEKPILYCDEIWTGIEYEIAGLMIYEGYWDKALEIVTGVRSRYNGARKNPWSEIECGGHYARAMSAYAMLLASSGFHQNKGKITINPRVKVNPCRFFYSTGQSWGWFSMYRKDGLTTMTIQPLFGKLLLNELSLPAENGKYRAITLVHKDKENKKLRSIDINSTKVSEYAYQPTLLTVEITTPCYINPFEKLEISVTWY